MSRQFYDIAGWVCGVSAGAFLLLGNDMKAGFMFLACLIAWGFSEVLKALGK